MMKYLTKILPAVAFSICTLFAYTAANAATLNVHNQTSMTMSGLYISRPSSAIWGYDQLDRYIMPGQSAQVGFDGGGACVFDLHAFFIDGTESDSYDVDLCQVGDWVISD
jgi:hypothetical protein